MAQGQAVVGFTKGDSASHPSSESTCSDAVSFSCFLSILKETLSTLNGLDLSPHLSP